jgi:hypothetical protein
MVRLPCLAVGFLIQTKFIHGRRHVILNNGLRRRRWARSWRLDLFETLVDRIDLAINAEAVVGSRTSELLRGTVRRLASIVQKVHRRYLGCRMTYPLPLARASCFFRKCGGSDFVTVPPLVTLEVLRWGGTLPFVFEVAIPFAFCTSAPPLTDT